MMWERKTPYKKKVPLQEVKHCMLSSLHALNIRKSHLALWGAVIHRMIRGSKGKSRILKLHNTALFWRIFLLLSVGGNLTMLTCMSDKMKSFWNLMLLILQKQLREGRGIKNWQIISYKNGPWVSGVFCQPHVNKGLQLNMNYLMIFFAGLWQAQKPLW